MKIKLLILLTCLTWQLSAQLTLKVTSVPSNTPLADNIHVAGSFQNWDPASSAHILTKNGDGSYQITINPPTGAIEFKFTRGSWATVEGTANGGELTNRQYNYTGGAATVNLSILTWKDLAGSGANSTAADNVHILSNSFFMPQLNRNRRIWIYLPPDYETSSKHYPVLYMHDAQNVFDEATSFSGEWEVDESLNQLFSQGDYGCIVVAVDNGQGLRADELSPWYNDNYEAGGEGGAYMDFFVETLKPHIDSNYRTLPAREYTGIMGSSLGGLISQYGIIEHQEVYSKAGIFSPAFWFNPEVFNHAGTTTKQFGMKIYSIAGYPEDNGSVVDDVNTMNGKLLGNGFNNSELKKVFHGDGQHSEWYWAREFPAAYIWLFGDLNLTSASEIEQNKIRFRPNPADTLIWLDNLDKYKKPTYQMYTADGKTVASGRLNSNQIDVSNFKPGVYVLNIISKKKLVFSEKVVVE